MSSAWVTLATNDGYAIGALVLGHSLRISNTKHKLHIMYTENVSENMRNKLNELYDETTLVNVLDSNDKENLELIGRPDLGITFTKLHCWRLTQYNKCVFLDADTLIIKNSDELFERPEFSAAPDIGWPDFFNSGVYVFIPSLDTYHNLLKFAVTHGTFDGGDQGLLNQYFNNWRELDANHRLPFIYNTTTGAIYSYAAAIKKYGAMIKIVHFLGSIKPWHTHGSVGFVSQFLDYWYQIYNQNVKQSLPHGTNPSYITFVPSAVPEPKVSPKKEAWRQTSYYHHHSIPTSTVTVTPTSTTTVKPDISKSVVNIGDSVSSVVKTDSVSVNTVPTDTVDSSSPVIDTQEIEEEPVFIDEETQKEERYLAWDQGVPDYRGRDAFENIQRQIEESLQEKLFDMDKSQGHIHVRESPQVELEPEHLSSEHGIIPESSSPNSELTIPDSEVKPEQTINPTEQALTEMAEEETFTLTTEHQPQEE